MQRQDEERLSLLPRNTAERHSARSAKAISLLTLERFTSAVNAISLPLSPTYPLQAYPELFNNVRKLATYVALPFCGLDLASNVAAARNAKISFCGHEVEIGSARARIMQVKSGTNTFIFTLGFYIAAYIAAYAAANKIGEDEVDVSDVAYFFGFVAPSALIGLSHSYLEVTKLSWENVDTTRARFNSHAYMAVNTLYNAGTLNGFILFVLSWANISESGRMNPNERLALFLGAFAAGLFMQVMSRRNEAAVRPIKQFFNTISTVNYLSLIFEERSKDIYDENVRAALASAFGVLAVATLVSSILKPTIERVVDPVAQVAAPGVSVRSDASSHDDVQLLAPMPSSESSHRISPAMTEYNSSLGSISSASFFSRQADSPDRVASVPVRELEKMREIDTGRRYSSPF